VGNNVPVVWYDFLRFLCDEDFELPVAKRLFLMSFVSMTALPHVGSEYDSIDVRVASDRCGCVEGRMF